MTTTAKKKVVNNLSLLIWEAGVQYGSEAQHPSFDPDRMDDRLDFFKKRTAALRQLREQFEDEMAKETP